MINIFIVFVALFVGCSVVAQDLPQASPAAKMEETIGLTKVGIDYSRPSVKGRTIFGGLVPYDKIWRLGANACTKFTCSTEMFIQGQSIEAGTYAVFAIPSGNGTWQVLFNTDTEQWGAGNYDSTKDVLVAQVKAKDNPMTETFTITIQDVTDKSGTLVIMWDKIKVELTLDVDTDKIAEKNIKDAIAKGEELDKVYYNAAKYYYTSRNDDKKALAYIHKGLNAKKGHALYFLRAQILKKQGHTKEAIEEAGKAYDMALESENKQWAEYIKQNVEEWRK